MKYSVATSVFVLLLSCFAVLQVLCGPIAAAHQLSLPRLGVVRYANGGVYLLYGLHGNYVVGPQIMDNAGTISFSHKGGLVARKGVLTLLDSEFTSLGTFALEGSEPLLNIDGELTTAVAWLPSEEKLIHWNGQMLVAVPFSGIIPEGRVSSVSKRDSKTVVLLLHSKDGSVSQVSLALDSGHLTSITPLPAVHGPAFRQESFVIFREGQELVITKPSDGSEKRIPLIGKDLEVERVASDCFHVRSEKNRRDWIIYFRQNDCNVEELPPPASDLPSVTHTAEMVR